MKMIAFKICFKFPHITLCEHTVTCIGIAYTINTVVILVVKT